MKTGIVWYLDGPKVSGCQMVWFLNGGLKIGQKLLVLWSKMSSFLDGHVIGPFENRTKKCLKSQMFGFQVFGIQMVTIH